MGVCSYYPRVLVLQYPNLRLEIGFQTIHSQLVLSSQFLQLFQRFFLGAVHLIVAGSQGDDKLVSFHGDMVSFLVEGVDALLEGCLKALKVLVIISQLVIKILDFFILLEESFLLCFAFSG